MHLYSIFLCSILVLGTSVRAAPAQSAEYQRMFQDFRKPADHETGYTDRQKEVIETMKWAWKGYKEHAWGRDHLHPVSKTADDWFGLGLTLIDALDTLWLMGLTEEFNEARDWVANHLSFDVDTDVNLFETTIRILGGLLSTYHLSGDVLFYEKAVDLADRLMPAFSTVTGIPYSDVNLKTGNVHSPVWARGEMSTSEATTIQLEFRFLSFITGDRKYADAVNKVMNVVERTIPHGGLAPISININTGRFSGHVTLGARVDSYYEYLFKQYLITNQTDTRSRDMFIEAMNSVKERLVKKTAKNGYTFIGELLSNGKKFKPKMDHLVCWLGGTLALANVFGCDPDDTDLQLAKDLTHTCNLMYTETAVGLAPEIAHFNIDDPNQDDFIFKPQDSHNLLRPETVESMFILHRTTNDPKYQEWGYEIFKNFEKNCKIGTGGYSSLKSVLKNPPEFRDKMESFFLGETLKYLFLLMGTDASILRFNQYVFNTEAHPLPIFTPVHK